MPRRSFFRPGGDKKSKQERKLQQKISRQQHSQSTDPPSSLGTGDTVPAQPTSIQSIDVRDVRCRPSYDGGSLTRQFPDQVSGPRHVDSDSQQFVIEENFQQYQNATNGFLVPSAPNQQAHCAKEYGHQVCDPQQNFTTPSFPQHIQNSPLKHQQQTTPQTKHQYSQQQYDYPQQNIQYQNHINSAQTFLQQQQQLQQQPHHGVVTTQTIIPTVECATDEIWRCETDDFRSASHAIQMLRLAIVAEWEQCQIMAGNDSRSGGENIGRGHGEKSMFSFDPSETFLCLQGAALRCHAKFDSMRSEHINKIKTTQKYSSQRDDSDHDRHPSHHFESMGDNSLEWELTEQSAWEVWEESVRAAAALAHAFVGPSWRKQLKLRRQMIRQAEKSMNLQSHLQARGRSRDSDSVGANSTGGISYNSNTSMDGSIPLQPSTLSFGPGSGSISFDGSERTMVTDDLLASAVIPEVLPAAMIRFAASAIETCVPPLRDTSTKIYWESDKLGVSSGGNEALFNALGRHLHDERRWLRRRKRLGDTQRDLAFSMFCSASEINDNNKSDSGDARPNNKQEWTIPGVHEPVAVMLHSWLETSLTGWPVVTVDESDNVPFYFESFENDVPEFIGTDTNDIVSIGHECKDDINHAPPAEIVFPTDAFSPADSSTDFVDPVSEMDYSNKRKYSLWEEIVDVSRVDWWYTLQVLRDCFDLASAGWRPPPAGRIGEEIVLGLIKIAEDGLLEDSRSHHKLPEQQTQRERLLACSCAAESLATLKNLASRNVLPDSTVTPLASSLCRLLSAAETDISNNSECKQTEDSVFDKGISTQKIYVASNSAEILWMMLSNGSTCCQASDALLEAIDVDLSLNEADSENGNVDDSIYSASGSIRALSAALFGDPPSVKGVPLLRFFWEPVINLLGKVASTIFRGNGNSLQIEFSLVDDQMNPITLSKSVCRKKKSLVIVLEIVLALRRLIDSEMVYGNGDLCPNEWMSLIKALDVGLSPWLMYPAVFDEQSKAEKIQNIDQHLQQEIFAEVMILFSQVQGFLLKCSQSKLRPFHHIADDECREHLHKFLLRRICPALARIGDAESLALAVIKSWCVVGYLPFRDGNWSKSAVDLLVEANASILGHGSQYPGGYVHSPEVRLEAFKSLVDDYNDKGVSNLSAIDSESVSTVTSASFFHCDVPDLSLFSLTRNLRDLHLELIQKILLPQIIAILEPNYEVSFQSHVLPKIHLLKPKTDSGNEIEYNSSDVDCLGIMEKEFRLRKFAVRVLGILFRSVSGDGDNRCHFIELLKLVAVSEPHSMESWIDETINGDHNQKILVKERLIEETYRLRLEALRQMELCLRAPFSELPHTHGSVPIILKALGETASFFVKEKRSSTQSMGLGQYIMSLLTLASVIPLARLSCTLDGRGLIMPKDCVTSIIPEDLLSAVSSDAVIGSIFSSDELYVLSEEQNLFADQLSIAPFVVAHLPRADDENESISLQNNMFLPRKSRRKRERSRGQDGKEGTTVDFEPVASVLKHVLQHCPGPDHRVHKSIELRDGTITSNSLSLLPSKIRMVCYQALSSFFSHGMTSSFFDSESLCWLQNSRSDFGDELVLKSQMILSFCGAIGRFHLSQDVEYETKESLTTQLCNILIELIVSKQQIAVENACWGLRLILGYLRVGISEENSQASTIDANTTFVEKSFEPILECACSVLETNDSTPTALLPIVNVLREVLVCTADYMSKSIRRRVFLTCFHLHNNSIAWHLQVLVFKCVAAVVDSMAEKETEFMLFIVSGSVSKSFDDVSKYFRMQSLVVDLLRRHLVKDRLKKINRDSGMSCCKIARVHNKLARDMLSMESFPVDVDEFGTSKSSAWLCGNIVLTFRVGSACSLYRGWIEIILRSPTCRLRRLVKWKTEITSDNVEDMLPFWDQLRQSGDKKVLAQPTSSTESEESSPWRESQLIVEKSRDVMIDARSTIDRFDRLLESSSCTVDSEKLNFSSVRSRAEVFSSLMTPSEFWDEMSKQNDPISDSKVGLKRTLSDGNFANFSESSPSELRKTEMSTSSVHAWLEDSLGNAPCEKELIQELEAFGFSREALGFPLSAKETSLPTNTPSLYFSDKLAPFSNDAKFRRALSILDRLTPFQTHKIGLFYGGSFGTKKNRKGDANISDKDKILMATQASTDFWLFAKELGDLVPVCHLKYFSGGLDTSVNSADGSFAIVWFENNSSDDDNSPVAVDTMAIFHAVCLMPDGITNRKRHVGNDMVHVVYGVESLEIDHENLAISGQFGFVTIYITPFKNTDLVQISVHLKNGLDEPIRLALEHVVRKVVVSRRICAALVRSTAIHADLICRSMIQDKLGLVLNCEERSKRIHEMNRHLKKCNT